MLCVLAMPLHDDTLLNEEDLPLSLKKHTPERRSGHDRRDPHDSARQFRQEIEREYRAEIRQLREEETHKDLEIAELKTHLAEVREWQKSKEKVLDAADQVVSAGIAFKWIIGTIIGTTMLIGGISASIEIIRAWTK